MIFLKKVLKNISLLILVLFSFFYTDKVMDLVNRKDPLMNKINLLKDKYEILPVNAILEDNTIIPGIKGKSVNLDKSYENMKKSGIFREDHLIYNDILPSEMLSNNMDKYIIKGNDYNNRVSLLIILDPNNMDKVKNKDVTIFLNHKDISINNIKKMYNNSIYTYGNNGLYNDDILSNDNTIINRVSNNKSVYCLSKEKNTDVLNACNNNKMYVIIPNVIGDYYEIKSNISNGSIILLNNINNLDVVIKYINSKGYSIVSLNKLLEE